jgi:hypothetical protein
VLTALSIWEKDPDGDFSSFVDTVKLFEFVDEVRTVDRVWTREFDTAQEIGTWLRTEAFCMLGRASAAPLVSAPCVRRR